MSEKTVARRDLEGRRALVMGLGSFGGGLGAVRHLASRGARVCVTDLRDAATLSASLAGLAGLDVELVLGEHRPADFAAAEIVVANPAVRPDDPHLATARRAGARITTEIELFLEATRGRVACVTGTQGKSSTCHMLAALLSRTGHRTFLGGNIGGSLLGELDRIGESDLVVLEISSYQLETLSEPRQLGARVEVVAITNVLADHLERHGDVAGYARAKGRILELVAGAGHAIVPGGDGRFAPPAGRGVYHGAEAEDRPRLVLAGGSFVLERADGGREVLGGAADLALPGPFQRQNALVALGAARLLGADPARLAAAVASLDGLEHRLQDLGLVRGRRVHDNAVSTTPDSTISALQALAPGVVLLVGGRKKALPLAELAAVAAARCRHVIAFGEAREALRAALGPAGVAVSTTPGVAEAVAEAFRRTGSGDEILFSPACSSFDAYPNFRARAEAFRRALAGEGATREAGA
ncbi:MAG: UDP-N-acetylmuramoyl-L-alanine--D-glutamate ligase [Planctomycetota bacterium]